MGTSFLSKSCLYYLYIYAFSYVINLVFYWSGALMSFEWLF